MVRTPTFHVGDRGSIPRGAITMPLEVRQHRNTRASEILDAFYGILLRRKNSSYNGEKIPSGIPRHVSVG